MEEYSHILSYISWRSTFISYLISVGGALLYLILYHLEEHSYILSYISWRSTLISDLISVGGALSYFILYQLEEHSYAFFFVCSGIFIMMCGFFFGFYKRYLHHTSSLEATAGLWLAWPRVDCWAYYS